MAHTPETKLSVRNAYVFDKLDIGTAAMRAGVSRGTAQRWKSEDKAKGDDWDRARSASSLSTNDTRMVAEIVLADFMMAYQATMQMLNEAEDILAPDRVDLISKMSNAFMQTMSSVAKAAPDLGRYAVASELLRDLSRFTSEEYPQHLDAILEILEPFAIKVANKYNT